MRSFQKKYFGYLLVIFAALFQDTCYGFYPSDKVSVRNSRQAENKTGCYIPTVENGRVVGLYAHTQTTLLNAIYECDEGYGVFPPTPTISCSAGKWNAVFPKCIRTCSVRLPELVDISCEKDGIQLDCYDPLVDGAKQYMQCKPRYSDNNPFNRPSVECNAACGQLAPKGKPLIVNGVPAKAGEFPWHVAIYRKEAEDLEYEYICGGSIINPYIVLTAAHCFCDGNCSLFNIHEFSMAAGKYFRQYNSSLDLFAQKRQIKRVVIPPDYSGFLSSYSGDLALAIVYNSFEFTNAVQSVCLDWNNFYEKEQLKENAFGMVAGWGFTTEGSDLAVELKKLTVPYINHKACINAVPENFIKFVTPDKFCTGYRNGSGVCNGDSGGGLVFFRNEDKRYYIRGLVSIGPISQGTCDSNQYGAYTKVSHYMDYIRSVTETYSGKCKRQYNQLDNSTSVSICINGTWNRPPLVCLPECGEPVPKDTLVIIGGTPTKNIEFPWHAGIYVQHPKYKNFSFACSGSIISTKLVLTSARRIERLGIQGRNSYVAVGKYYLDYESVLDILAQKRKVRSVEYPPDWLHRTYRGPDADLAIVIVEETFTFNNFIRPVCLDTQNRFTHPVNEAFIAGWNFTYGENILKGEFKKVAVPYEQNNKCVRVLKDLYLFVEPDVFCSLFPEGKQICDMETGGGLVVYSNKDKKYYIIGVLNNLRSLWYPECENHIRYTNITQYINFIKQTEEKYKTLSG